MGIEKFVKKAIEEFCIEYVMKPYLCYTEHGHHARFYLTLYNMLPQSERYFVYNGEEVCVIQKEYPTAHNLDKSRRQNWDIAVLKRPVSSGEKGEPGYDYLPLNSVVEFGLNAGKEHLVEDIRRLCHKNSNVTHKFIVHLYRISTSGNLISGRDWSEKSKRILSLDEITDVVTGYACDSLLVYVGIHDKTFPNKNGVWAISKSGRQQVFPKKI